ncbi:CysB family HTH-type transcriptional regulator [Inhella proteolytica]|uniref:CysB family HTH-type transcriptional regulator n=1 Tax=Inhella proteolytica TaxID=2795029 RepID=A0A931J0S0_9BURK|nr:CysB family HTH-type transcriptional regulator [Inhella proteolytica]MBH9575429.1 CysB family HTH-type transcriptional regulator [Inhella proteolytica]
MNFQQLRSVRETVRQGFNLTQVAEALHTSQPGVSRQIKELEDELAAELFVRAGRRFLGLTATGELALPIIERLLQEAENLRRVAADFVQSDSGMLTVAATHTQARYVLPGAVRDFRASHPRVSLHLQQGSPRQIAELVASGAADLGIATEALADYPDLVTLPCYRWSHVVVVPRGHELAHLQQPLTLEQLAQFPLVTYEPGYTGRRHIDEAFERAGLDIDVVLSAMDADVIKTYVDLGIGVGIVASVAFDEARDDHLVALDARHLFALNTTRVAIKRGAVLRSFVLEFIQTFAPTLTREVVASALAAKPAEDPEG